MTSPEPDDTDDVWKGPRSFDDFEVVRPLGRGGMGQVFLGHDVVLDRPVALKFTAAEDPPSAVRARFLREARAIARLSHSNVVGIYRVGEVQRRPYIAYEFVQGDGLDRLRAPMPWARVARIALGLARGLAAAHRAGVLHRDVKPSNAMLTRAGDVKLLDFGLARFSDAVPDGPAVVGPLRVELVDANARTQPVGAAAGHLSQAGALLGTPAYLPPEAWRREPATERSDLYALGLVLYELLTGALPHGDGHAANVEATLLLDAPPVQSRCADVLASFAELVNQCVRRDPAERPASAEALAQSFERICALFLPPQAAAAPLREDRDADLVARSLQRAMARGDALTQLVYAKLFAARSDLRRLFPANLDGLRQKLGHALKLSIDGLGAHERVVPVLRDLGRRHAHLGLTSAEYAALGEAIVGALRELDPELDDEVAHAWRRAYAFITNTMRSAGASPGAASHTRAASQEIAGPPSPSPPVAPSGPPPSGDAERPPPTRYAYVGDLGVAYQVFGGGRHDVMLHLGRVSHLDYGWRHPKMAGFLRSLGSLGRVALFDKRGTGLSERAVSAPGLQQRIEDPLAVLDAAGMKRVVFVGVGEGAAIGLLFSVLFPERVRAVVCFNGSVRWSTAPGSAGGHDPSFLDAAIERIRNHWGDPLFVDAEAPSMQHDPAFRAWFGEYLRSATSPGNAIAQLRLNASLDLRPILPHVRVPVLVLHRAENRLVRIEDGRYIAEHVLGARFVPLPGGDHLIFTGDVARVVEELGVLLSDPRLDDAPAAPLTTLALVRADSPDAALLAQAAEHFAALGARRLPHDDPRAVLVASPWFASLMEALARVVFDPEARAQGLRAALDAVVIDPGASAHDDPALRPLAEAAESAAGGECVVSPRAETLCAGLPLRFERNGDGRFARARPEATGSRPSW